MMSFFKSRPHARPGAQVPETGTAPTPPPPIEAPGQFSPKQIRAFVVVGGVLLLFFIITTGQPTKPKYQASRSRPRMPPPAAR